MAVLYGASVYNELGNPSNIRYDIIGKNSEAFTAGDIVTVDGTNGLKVAGATDLVVGVVVKTQTMSASNQTVAKISPGYVPAENTVFLMGSNGDFAGNVADPTDYYKITGTTGIQQVDQASGVTSTTSRIVEIVKVDPRGLGGTGSGSGLREVLVRFVKTPVLNVGGPA
jgi:hypothetical protein